MTPSRRASADLPPRARRRPAARRPTTRADRPAPDVGAGRPPLRRVACPRRRWRGHAQPPGARRPRTAILHAAAALAAVLAALALAPSPADAWSDRTHFLITGEAVERLPEPLRGLLAGEADLKRLQEASAAPDGWRKADSPHYRPGEKPRHFFDIDALTDEAYPFANFPRDRAAAEKPFGPEPFREHGSGPWAAHDAFVAFVDALAHGRTALLFEQGGAMAHYAADLHMPFHTTKNFDGKETGNPGLHGALEIGLVHRRLETYAAEVRRGRRDVAYLADPRAALFDWLIEAHARAAPILEADAEARRKTAYNPAAHPEDLHDGDPERARPYYDALRAELQARGAPEALALRDASAHLAQLIYTAWVRAGKPLGLAPPEAAAKETPGVPYWLLALMAALAVVVLLPRRRPPRPVPPPEEPS